MFGPEQIHIILYDEFAGDTLSAYQGVLTSLGVEPMFAPSDMAGINPNKRIPSRAVQRLVWEMHDSSSWLRRVGTRLIPVHRVRSALLRNVPDAARRFNSAAVPRPPVSSAVRMRIAQDLADDVHKLEELLNRDLSHRLGEAAGSRTQPRLSHRGVR